MPAIELIDVARFPKKVSKKLTFTEKYAAVL